MWPNAAPPHLESKAEDRVEGSARTALVSARGTRRGGDTLRLQGGDLQSHVWFGIFIEMHTFFFFKTLTSELIG